MVGQLILDKITIIAGFEKLIFTDSIDENKNPC